MQRLILSTILVCLGACFSTESKKSSEAADCETQGNRYGNIMGEALAKQKTILAIYVNDIEMLMVTACKEDGWPERSLGCMSVAKDNQIEACIAGMGDEISKKIDERVIAAASQMR